MACRCVVVWWLCGCEKVVGRLCGYVFVEVCVTEAQVGIHETHRIEKYFCKWVTWSTSPSVFTNHIHLYILIPVTLSISKGLHSSKCSTLNKRHAVKVDRTLRSTLNQYIEFSLTPKAILLLTYNAGKIMINKF